MIKYIPLFSQLKRYPCNYFFAMLVNLTGFVFASIAASVKAALLANVQVCDATKAGL